MRIHSFRYTDRVSGWKTDQIGLDGFNLLVGASGVGKTKLLSALLDVKNIAKGESLNGVAWDITFEMDHAHGHWQGLFQESKRSSPFDDLVLSMDEIEHTLLEEKLVFDGKEIFRKADGQIWVNESLLPVKLASSKSCLALLEEDESVRQIAKAFHYGIGALHSEQGLGLTSREHLKDSIEEEDLRDMRLPLVHRIIWAYQENRQLFDQIVCDFQAIFPLIRGVKAEFKPVVSLDKYKENREPPIVAGMISFEEQGVDHPIPHMSISAGMWKTFLLIANHYLCADNSVILIDEIENSLGVNCIDVLGELMDSDRGLQYIITSHHPYIINNVPLSRWKIVTRDHGMVQTHPASEFGIGASKHEAFMQLIQLDAFKYGTTEV